MGSCCFAGHAGLYLWKGERCHSVLNALCRIREEANAEDWVLVHDAARPCLRLMDIDRLVQELADDQVGGILACRLSDTVKRENGRVVAGNAPARTFVARIYTPDVFDLDLLYEALSSALQTGKSVTDEASAIEMQD